MYVGQTMIKESNLYHVMCYPYVRGTDYFAIYTMIFFAVLPICTWDRLHSVPALTRLSGVTHMYVGQTLP